MPTRPFSQHPYAYAHANPVNYTDPSGQCLGYLWNDPSCQFAGTDYTRYDYVGAGKVVVTGLGVAATVVACGATAGVACIAGSAGATAVTSWGNQALDNAGRPVYDAALAVDWGAVGREAGIAGITGPVGGFAGRGVRYVCRIGLGCATAIGSAVGATSSGVDRFLNNLLDGDPCTDPTDGVFQATIFGGAVGGLSGRIGYRVQNFAQQANQIPIPVGTRATLQNFAQQANQIPIPVGTRAGAAGTLKHSEFARLARALNRPDLTAEVNYLNGQQVRGNLLGSVRLDIVEGPINAPIAVYDLKTGASALTAQRIAQIRSHLPNGGILPDGSAIPVIEIRL